MRKRRTRRTGETHAHEQVDSGRFAHTGDLTGPTQPHGELGKENPYLHDGGIELHGEILINLAHESHTRDLYTHGGAISQEGLYYSKRIILNRGLSSWIQSPRGQTLEESWIGAPLVGRGDTTR